MAENNALNNWTESIVLIGYPSNFGNKEEFLHKTEQALESLKDFLLISIDDSKGYIEANYPAHVVESISSKDITDKEIIDLIQRVTHCLLFWDGDTLSKFVYQTLLLKKPCKIFPVRITKVANKDRGEEYDIYIGRKSIWGNPFVIDKDGNREQVIEKYKNYFYKEVLADEAKRNALHKLKGKRLGCHCKPLACHGDVIAEYLNSLSDYNLD